MKFKELFETQIDIKKIIKSNMKELLNATSNGEKISRELRPSTGGSGRTETNTIKANFDGDFAYNPDTDEYIVGFDLWPRYNNMSEVVYFEIFKNKIKVNSTRPFSNKDAKEAVEFLKRVDGFK
jgi:hypothetical protein